MNKTSALVAVIPVISYASIAGMGVGAVRSTILILSFLLALFLDREKGLTDAQSTAAPPGPQYLNQFFLEKIVLPS